MFKRLIHHLPFCFKQKPIPEKAAPDSDGFRVHNVPTPLIPMFFNYFIEGVLIQVKREFRHTSNSSINFTTQSIKTKNKNQPNVFLLCDCSVDLKAQERQCVSAKLNLV